MSSFDELRPRVGCSSSGLGLTGESPAGAGEVAGLGDVGGCDSATEGDGDGGGDDEASSIDGGAVGARNLDATGSIETEVVGSADGDDIFLPANGDIDGGRSLERCWFCSRVMELAAEVKVGDALGRLLTVPESSTCTRSRHDVNDRGQETGSSSSSS